MLIRPQAYPVRSEHRLTMGVMALLYTLRFCISTRVNDSLLPLIGVSCSAMATAHTRSDGRENFTGSGWP